MHYQWYAHLALHLSKTVVEELRDGLVVQVCDKM